MKTVPSPDAGQSAPAEAERPRKRTVGRTIGLAVYGIVAGVVAIALIAVGAIAFTVQRSFPQLGGEAALAGLNAPVTVQRDALGIPTITATDTHDLFFAQGFVHAQDRFWEMDFRRHLTSGRLSELFGQSQLGTDQFLRTLGWHDIAEQEYELLDDTTRNYYDAYAEGVNAYLADHQGADASLEYAVLGLQNSDYEIEPWTPADSIAWLKAMAWDLRTNVKEETERAIAAETFTESEMAELYPRYPFDTNPVIVPKVTTDAPPPTASAEPAEAGTGDLASGDTAGGGDAAGVGADAVTATASVDWHEVSGVVAAVDALLGAAGEGIGSNSWVISGKLSETGEPLLSNDPHLGAALPSVWYQVQLTCANVGADCPFDVAGFSFSGLPGVVMGHNDRIAWGFTNLRADVTDLYLEKVEGDQYWRDGALVPLDERTETIKVAGGDDVPLTIRSTANGPIVSGLTGEFTTIADDPYVGTSGLIAEPANPPTGEYAVSLKWTALTPGMAPAALLAIDRAQSFADFRAAAALFEVPAQNLIYADVDGNIGYQTPGKLPIRGAGDGSMPQPGWDSAYDWQGYIPFEALPVVYNPESGYIVTANNAVIADDDSDLRTPDWDIGWRAARIADLIERRSANGKLTADDMRDIQADNELWIGKRLAAAYAQIKTGDDKTDAALALLHDWDAQNDSDSPAAAYANVLWDTLAQSIFVEGRDRPASVSGQARLFLVVDRLLENPDSDWWKNPAISVTGQQEMLVHAARTAYDRLAALQGASPSNWKWGTLHALTLRNGSFGESGIAPIEWLFNRGPYPVGGGASIPNATGWEIGTDFSTVTVPSMRMIVDLSDFDASGWNHLTGASGHAFHPNYVDQTATWQAADTTPWAYSADAVAAATTDTLTLVPAS
ncbi:penicillin acylase family protein [Microbacterium sp. BWT-B31]|uniref:penicillin acylase family protein n=1 Tax=Microbacterium sp. BWT-B31 TaxID=3232072 RepID=UPI0035282C77